MNLFKETFTPMLLTEKNKPFNNRNYIFEPKFDGIRALIYANKNQIKILSRNKNNISNLFPELIKIKNNITKNVIFDGEIIIMDENHPSFEKISKRLHLKNKKNILKASKENPAVYICFDILYENENLTNFPLLKRKKVLEKYLDTNVFIKTKYFKDGINLFNKIKNINWEGIVAKKENSKYEINKRSENWIKIKNIKDSDFYINGYIENKKSVMNTLILSEKIKGKFYYRGKVTINKNKDDFKIIKNNKIVKKSTLVNFNEKDVFYIKPTLKCTVTYTEKTKNNTLRHPVYKTLKS